MTNDKKVKIKQRVAENAVRTFPISASTITAILVTGLGVAKHYHPDLPVELWQALGMSLIGGLIGAGLITGYSTYDTVDTYKKKSPAGDGKENDETSINSTDSNN